jgi:hypothetical protein
VADEQNLPPTEGSAPASATPAPAATAGGAGPTGNSIPPEVLKSAFNAFKKRWKLTLLDHESRIGRGPMSSGNKSTIIGIVPPDQFPRAVWEALVKQGKLKYTGSGLYSRV